MFGNIFRAYFIATLLLCGLIAMTPTGARAQSSDVYADDKQALVDHVDQIFKAFVDRDRGRIRSLHSEDWVGFLGPSTQIERGIDDYMVNADRSLDSFKGIGYEIQDTEVQIYGDIALVFYVASYFYEAVDDSTTGSIPLRSIDVFRRDDGQWIQSASHISVIPDGGRWGEGE